MKHLLRLIKPMALWWNAFLYGAVEDEIQMRAALLSHVDDYRDSLRLSAEMYRLHLRQRKLQARRERFNQW